MSESDQDRELQALHAEVEGLLYSVCHDLRSPLRVIQGFAEALEDERDRLDDEGREYLGRVVSSARQMDSMVADLHRLAQVTRSELRSQRVDLSAMAESVAAALRQAGPERAVEFAIERGLIVNGDPGLLRILLENLFQNAWKFTRIHPTARVELGSELRDGRRVFYVRDDGAGFDPAYAGRLFSPFQRLHARTEFEGNGIGLAIVRRVVHRHHGRVWAEGWVGKGASVFIELL